MAQKYKTREIILVEKGGTFDTFLKKFSGSDEKYDFESLSSLRRLLSNEKARLIHLIKSKKPKSIYELAKLAKRDFKSVVEDVKLFEKFGLIEMISEKTGKRERLKPTLTIDSLYIHLRF